jgi:crotonobetainyl-CoA:carnitine CoA-transferase CaiB-like acyl-CoA transferase
MHIGRVIGGGEAIMKLSGVRVLDLTRFLPGPYLAGMLADHGAEVIKIEEPKSGDPSRQIGPKEGGSTSYFRQLNRGKKSLALDLKAAEGKEIFLSLAARADIVVESFRPGVVDRLGIGYRAVRARTPGIIYCSLSAFGQSGPYRDRPAHDLAVGALAGTVALSQDADGVPAIPGLPTSDLAAALLGLSGVLMALYRRRGSGLGDYLDLAMLDASLSFTAHLIGRPLIERRAPEPAHERTLGGAAFYRPYRTSDQRYVALGGSEPKFIETLLNALGRPDLIPLGREAPGPAQAPLHRFLEATFAERSQAEWVAWFADKDVCFAPVLDLKQALDDPNLAARDMVVGHEGGGRQLGLPIKFENEPGAASPHAPALGEDTAGILRGLGFDAPRIAALEAAGVIRCARAKSA